MTWLIRFALYRAVVFGAACIAIFTLMAMTRNAIDGASAFVDLWWLVQQTLLAASG